MMRALCYAHRSRGFVKTLCGRRRYLPKITAGANMHARAAAERQAINTAVQGSAADLVKAAMNKIEGRVAEVFPLCRVPLRPSSRNLERHQGCQIMVHRAPTLHRDGKKDWT